MGFSRQEYWSGLPCPPPGDLPDPGIEPRSLALQVNSLGSEPPGKPLLNNLARIRRKKLEVFLPPYEIESLMICGWTGVGCYQGVVTSQKGEAGGQENLCFIFTMRLSLLCSRAKLQVSGGVCLHAILADTGRVICPRYHPAEV